jgi:hypothetical protein
MANWKFLVARHYGGSNQRKVVCSKIKMHVENLGLSSVLPLAKYETSKGMEYYLGLAFDDSVPDGLKSACHVLSASGIPVGNTPYIFEPEKVRSLLRGSLEFESFTIPILYERESEPENISSNQILSLTDIEDSQPIDNSSNDEDIFDKLLYWCSSTGSGDLAHLKKVIQILDINTEWGGVWSIVRRFTLLGHLEFDMSNSPRWGVIPPTLIRMSASDRYFLAGQRVPSLVTYLERTFNAVKDVQNNGPTQIIIEGDNNQLSEIGSDHELQKLGCVSEKLSRRLPSFTQWLQGLPLWNEKDFSRYTIEEYSPDDNDFHLINNCINFKIGLYKFIFKNSNHKIETLAYYNDKLDNWLCGDLYSLRFLARNNLSLCQAFFLDTQKELRIPLTDRWPMPFERALVLASGKLPGMRETTYSGERILSYSNISCELATQLCDLLSIKMDGK